MIYTDHALNDAVLHGYGDCVQLTAWCNGDTITSFSGDASKIISNGHTLYVNGVALTGTK